MWMFPIFVHACAIGGAYQLAELITSKALTPVSVPHLVGLIGRLALVDVVMLSALFLSVIVDVYLIFLARTTRRMRDVTQSPASRTPLMGEHQSWPTHDLTDRRPLKVAFWAILGLATIGIVALLLVNIHDELTTLGTIVIGASLVLAATIPSVIWLQLIRLELIDDIQYETLEARTRLTSTLARLSSTRDAASMVEGAPIKRSQA